MPGVARLVLSRRMRRTRVGNGASDMRVADADGVRARKKSLATGSSETGGVVDDHEDAGRWQLENVRFGSELGMVDAGEDGTVADVMVKETLAWSTKRRRGLQLQH
jgi:hypothetical protein